MLTQHSLPPLSHVEVRTSGIIPAPVADVWKTVRSFGTVADWSAPIGMERITSILLPGSMEGQLGALRRVCFGELGFVEQLDALDDEKKLLKWRVISHPLNTNPFPGSFLNYRGRLRLREVTLNNLTLVELEGGFDTEHANAEVMRRELKARQEANVRGLLALLTSKPSLSTQQRAAAVHPLMGSLPLPEGWHMQNASIPPNSIPQVTMTHLSGGGQGGVILPNGQVALVPGMANLGLSSVSHALPMGAMPGVGMQPASYINSGGYSTHAMPMQAPAQMVPPQAYAAQAAIPASVHQQLLAQMSTVSTGFMPPQQMMPQPGVLLPEQQITSYGSINSYDSQGSVGSARGHAMNKAFQKAQQQAQSGMLSEAQLARLRMQLQQQGIPLPEALQPRTSLESHPGVTGVMPDVPNAINTSGDSHASLPTSHISPRPVGPAQLHAAASGLPVAELPLDAGRKASSRG